VRSSFVPDAGEIRVGPGFFDEQREQSLVKAEIVQKYFFAWANVLKATILARRTRIAFIDLFCGPGRYKDGKSSVPLMILERAAQDDFLRDHLVTLFNDRDEDNSSTLRNEVAALSGVEKLRYQPVIQTQEIGEEIVKFFEDKSIVPTFFFVDPWGYKGLSLRLINTIIRDWGCECVFFFNYNRVNMGLNNESVETHMEALFGAEELDALKTAVATKSPAVREAMVIEAIAQSIKSQGSRYVLPFTFKFDDSERTSHYLIFVSKHVRGYEIMKEVMAKASSSHEEGVPSFSYANAGPETPLLFDFARPLTELGGDLCSQFAGQTLTMIDIYNAHHVGRRFIKRNYKEALKRLEAEGKVSCAPAVRKRGTFADDVRVTFPKI
jgi:three-Cys-motif partner protein